MAIKLAVFNQKGGVGKTTLAIILTQIALMKNKKVIAVDQDEKNHFNVSVSYLRQESKFKNLFTLKTSLTQEDFSLPADWIIIDCPPAINDRTRFILRNSDLILIPVIPDTNSVTTLVKICDAAGMSKKLFQLPLVKIGFTENVASRAADAEIRGSGHMIIGNLSSYATITSNISSGRRKWWSVGLQASARQYFKDTYRRLELLYGRLQQLRRESQLWKHEPPDYYDDPENPDIVLFQKRYFH